MLGLIKLNATGQKTGKKVTEAGNTIITHYLTGGFQYSSGFLQFFPHAEGYVTNVLTSTYCPTCRFKPLYSLNYVFNYTDHLGNVRLSYAQENGALKILEENSYYPFGLKHTRNNVNSKMFVETNGTTSLQTIGELTPYTTYFKNNYKYNGKELQDELGLNMYDYGARNYDPALGRWMNMDPMAELNRRWTPYNYTLNNPVYFIDPDGMLQVPNNNNGFIDKFGEPEKHNFDKFFTRTYDENNNRSDDSINISDKFEPNYIGAEGSTDKKKKKKEKKAQNTTQEASIGPGAAILAGGLTAAGVTVEVPPAAGFIILGTLIVYTGYEIYETANEIFTSTNTTIGHYNSMAQRGNNNGRLQDDELEAILARKVAGTASSTDLQKLKRHEKNTGQRSSRQSKDKKR
ncbi:MAG: RHS repeat-associated core domain-containing protein [Limnohabitans sp.]|nr:RHS repeat-associated core domain-containing protein [Limnohabitans sp.]